MTWKGWGRVEGGDWILVVCAPDDRQRARHELVQWVNHRSRAEGVVLPCHVRPGTRAAEALGEHVLPWRAVAAPD